MNTLFIIVTTSIVVFRYFICEVLHVFCEIIAFELFKHFLFVGAKNLGYSEKTTGMEGEGLASFYNRLMVHIMQNLAQLGEGVFIYVGVFYLLGCLLFGGRRFFEGGDEPGAGLSVVMGVGEELASCLGSC